MLATAYRWLLRAACVFTLYRLLKVWDAYRYALQHDEARVASIAARVVAAPVLSSMPRVSALAAAWNAGEDLDGLIRSFTALDYAAKELILAVGGAHAIEDLQHLAGPDVRLIPHPGGGKQRALQDCLQQATGEVIFLTDADCALDSGSFLSLLGPIVNGESSVTSGRHVPLVDEQDNSFVQLQWARSLFSFAHVQDNPNILGANCALTRETLQAAGGFAESVSAGTDVHLSSRLHAAGYRVRFVYESQVETHYHRDLLPYLRQRARWLRNLAFSARLTGDEPGLRTWRRQSLEAAVFIALTALVPLRRRPLLLLLSVPLLRRYLDWRRVLRFGERLRGKPWRLSPYAGSLAGVYVEALARTVALVDYLVPSRRHRW